MKLLLYLVALVIVASSVLATLNPSKNKKGKQKAKTVPSVIKVKSGPQENSVYERNLVDNEPLASDIIAEAHTYYKDTSLKNFNGSVLGYVTPVINKFILSYR